MKNEPAQRGFCLSTLPDGRVRLDLREDGEIAVTHIYPDVAVSVRDAVATGAYWIYGGERPAA